MESIKTFYENKIQFIRDEIDARTESLVEELHLMRDELFKKLDEIKSSVEKYIFLCWNLFSTKHLLFRIVHYLTPKSNSQKEILRVFNRVQAVFDSEKHGRP